MAGANKWGEGKVERGLREDQEQLAMGRRIGGGAGSGFGGEDASKLWELLPASIKDEYALISELGRGTYGTVILAENRNVSAIPRRVAVKLCKAKESEMGMLLKEGMAMQRLNSPMIARLVDMGCTTSRGGVVYTVLELLEGKSLNDIVQERGPLQIAEACRVAINVLDALRDVHRAGFIHRDIKPHNIIRVECGDGSWIYKLVDFGTATGALGAQRVGVPAFVTPSQTTPTSGAVNPGLRSVFTSMDAQQRGVLSLQDVFSSLTALGLRPDRKTIAEMVSKYDSDANGLIDEHEFGMMYGELVALPYAAYSTSLSNLPILEEVFKGLTGDRELMSFEMLSSCFDDLQRQMPEERVRALFHRYDANGDGQLALPEFIRMFGELVALQDSMNWSGTHGYMSPEQYNDEPVSPASDIWAVGATLFKITVGQTPFTVTGGTWGKGLVGDKTTEAPKLSNFLFNVPPAFAGIVGKALKKDPLARFVSATEMREAVAEVLAALGPMQAKAYISSWDSPGSENGDRTELYTHGVAWETGPNRR